MTQYLLQFRSRFACLLLALLAVSILLSSLKDVAGLSIGSILDVSNTDGMSSSPKIEVSETGEVFLAWGDSEAAPSDIFFANSSDSGVSFGSAINLSNDGVHSNPPEIAVTGNNVYLVWSADDGDVYFLGGEINVDNTVTFGTPVNISNNIGNSANPKIAASESNVYVVWEDDIDGSFVPDIFYANSTNSGQSFSIPNNLSSNEGFSQTARIALSDSGNVYVAWQDDALNPGVEQSVFVRGSADGGISFGELASVNIPSGFASAPQIHPFGTETLYIAWSDGNPDFDVYFASATLSTSDSGLTFGSEVNVSNNTGFSTAPQMTISGSGIIYIGWVDDISGSNAILLANSTNDGQSFSTPVSISQSNSPPTPPTMAILQGNQEDLLVGWEDANVGNSDIFISLISDQGLTIGDPVNISSNDGASLACVMATFGNKTYVSWQDSSSGNDEILFRSISTDEGSAASVSIESISHSAPKWGRDIDVSGISNGGTTDSITVDWGDGTFTPGIPLEGSNWGPVQHRYDSASVGERQISAKLLDSGGNEKATADSQTITVVTHETRLSIENYSKTVIEGEDFAVSGILRDLDDDVPIGDATVLFDGSGSSGLNPATSDEQGHYVGVGSAPPTAGTLWTLQSIFEGDAAYSPSTSEMNTFDTASLDAKHFDVPAGSPSTVELTGFNTSISFDNIASEISLYVSRCDTPNNPRFLSLEICLILSPTISSSADGSARVSISYAGKDLPIGRTAEEIDIFHETPSGYVDVTESRNLQQQTVTGRLESFSSIVVGIAQHSPPEGDVQQKQLYIGQNEVTFNPYNNPTISFENSQYQVGSEATIEINDNAANLNSTARDEIEVQVISSSDDRGITVTVIETGIDSGIFTGSFVITDGGSSSDEGLLHAETGDAIEANYIPTTAAPLNLVFESVNESGIVEIRKFAVDQQPFHNFPNFDAIGDAYSITLIDSQIDGDSKINIIMSYINVDIENEEPFSTALLRVIQFNGSGSGVNLWIDITRHSDDGLAIDPVQKTVGGTTSQPGNFTIAHDMRDPDSPGGGGGGGLPRPGTGVVLDAVATIATHEQDHHNSRRSSSGNTVSLQSILPGSDVTVESRVGSDVVEVNFDKVEPDSGQVKVSSQDISKSSKVFEEVSAENGYSQGVTHIDNVTYSTVGKIFDIDTTAVKFTGMVKITIPYDENQALLSNSELSTRFLHFDPEKNQWEDDTISIDTDMNTVTGVTDSLSPVVAAVANDGLFSQVYFDANPLHRIVIENQSHSIENLNQGSQISIPLTIKNIQRANQDYAAIIQIVDENGVVQYIDWQSSSLAKGQSVDVSRNWTPKENGMYTIQAFVWNAMDNPTPLSTINTIDIIVHTR